MSWARIGNAICLNAWSSPSQVPKMPLATSYIDLLQVSQTAILTEKRFQQSNSAQSKAFNTLIPASKAWQLLPSLHYATWQSLAQLRSSSASGFPARCALLLPEKTQVVRTHVHWSCPAEEKTLKVTSSISRPIPSCKKSHPTMPGSSSQKILIDYYYLCAELKYPQGQRRFGITPKRRLSIPMDRLKNNNAKSVAVVLPARFIVSWQTPSFVFPTLLGND